MTNSYFEGMCADNPKAQFSKNQKVNPTDCRQIVFALVLDSEGFVHRHRTFAGKQSDVSSLSDILDMLQNDFKTGEIFTIIMDRGIASRENIELLKSKNLSYIIASRNSEEQANIEVFKHSDFQTIKNSSNENVQIYGKLLSDGDYGLFCKSASKEQKKQRCAGVLTTVSNQIYHYQVG